MRLRESLEAVAAIRPEGIEDLRQNGDPEWIQQALEATGTATLRPRRLPAQQVVWLVIDLALPGSSLTVASSTVVEARVRLCEDPIRRPTQRTSGTPGAFEGARLSNGPRRRTHGAGALSATSS
jgi:hypothetical protein